MISDPWREIPVPDTTSALSARRVNADSPWDFFWARDLERRCLLILTHHVDNLPARKLPVLKEIEVSLSVNQDDQKQNLSLKLTDMEHRSLFHQLCSDIIDSTAMANTEREAVQAALGRVWRWHHLLRGGRTDSLSVEEQKGLIGELLVLERYLLPNLTPNDSLTSWGGPNNHPKDFSIGPNAIEAKSRSGTSRPYVSISSEHQLDTTDVDNLFLHVVDLNQVPSDSGTGFTLTEIAERLSGIVKDRDQGSVDLFDSLLISAGFDWGHDYTSSRWIEGSNRIYHVSPDFPRVEASQLSAGVESVTYSISLVDCEPFLVEESTLHDVIQGDSHGS